MTVFLSIEFNEATIKEESIPMLKEVTGFMNIHPNVVIFVVGHTYMTGEVSYNINLSQRRTHAVTDYLINEYGVAPERLLPHGAGPLVPAKTNETETGRESNRRVELVLKSN